jgi:hypothetical protein
MCVRIRSRTVALLAGKSEGGARAFHRGIGEGLLLPHTNFLGDEYQALLDLDQVDSDQPKYLIASYPLSVSPPSREVWRVRCCAREWRECEQIKQPRDLTGCILNWLW